MHLESFPLFVHIAWEPWSALWLIVFHLGLRKVRRTGIIGSRFKNSHGCKRWCYMTVGPDAAAAVAAAEADFKKIPVSSPERKNHGAIMPRKAWEQKSFSVPRNSSENPPNTYQSLQKAYNTVCASKACAGFNTRGVCFFVRSLRKSVNRSEGEGGWTDRMCEKPAKIQEPTYRRMSWRNYFPSWPYPPAAPVWGCPGGERGRNERPHIRAIRWGTILLLSSKERGVNVGHNGRGKKHSEQRK